RDSTTRSRASVANAKPRRTLFQLRQFDHADRESLPTSCALQHCADESPGSFESPLPLPAACLPGLTRPPRSTTCQLAAMFVAASHSQRAILSKEKEMRALNPLDLIL